MEDVAKNKKKQLDLESDLLVRLTSIKGSLVDDPTIIEVLKTTKQTASEVSAKLIVADQTRKKINNAREEYRPVASCGSIVYFLISEMTMVNVMYQVSLKQFLGLFDQSLAKYALAPHPSHTHIIARFSHLFFVSGGIILEHRNRQTSLLELQL